MSTNRYGTTTFRAKVTGRHAVTLPAGLCRQIGIEVGDIVEFEVSGNQALLKLADEEPEESLRGILKGTFPDWEAIARFIEEERAGWDEREALIEAMISTDEKRFPD